MKLPERIQPMKPILFSTEMVKAILEGRKTMTRRRVKDQPDISEDDGYVYFWNKGYAFDIHKWKEECVIGARYKTGYVLWVRETWCNDPRGSIDSKSDCYYYKADFFDPDVWKGSWKPSIFMPKEAARLFLKVTNVRIERLHDITEEDAIKEGVEMGIHRILKSSKYKNYYDSKNKCGAWYNSPVDSFVSLWESINGYGSWIKNPWCWVYEFEKLKEEIKIEKHD